MTKRIFSYSSHLLSPALAVWFAAILIGGWGCSRKPDADRSLLTDDPCAAPCWHNIIPGESNEDDVLRELENSPYVKSGTLNRGWTMINGIDLTYYSWQGRDKVLNRVYLQNDRVLRIELHPNDKLAFGDVVDKFGPPENVYARFPPGGTVTYLVYLDYPALGMSFCSFSGPISFKKALAAPGYGVLSEDLLVTSATYFAPTSLEQMYRRVYLYSDERVEYYMTWKQEWPGFGRVRVAE